MKMFVILILLSLLLPSLAVSQTIVTGDVSGTWRKAGSPYIIDGDVTVQAGAELVIDPGVTVRWMPRQDFSTFEVRGSLVVAGEEGDSVLFTSNALRPGPNEWGTVVFNGGSARISHAKFEYYKPAMEIGWSRSIEVRNSRFIRYDITQAYLHDTVATQFAVGGQIADTMRIHGCTFEGISRTKDGISLSTATWGILSVDSCQIVDFSDYGMKAIYSGINADSLNRKIIVSNSIINHTSTGLRIDGENQSEFRIEANRVTDCENGIVIGYATLGNWAIPAEHCDPMILSNDIFNHSKTGLRVVMSTNPSDTCIILGNRIHHCNLGLWGGNDDWPHEPTYFDIQFNTIAYCTSGYGGNLRVSKFQNNIFAWCQKFSGPSTITNGYNIYWNYTSRFYNSTWKYSVVTGDMYTDPRFVGEYDLHLASNSPAIDRANPHAPVGDEPEPNGGRANVGAYGQTTEATTSPLRPIRGILSSQWRNLRFPILENNGDYTNKNGVRFANYGDSPLIIESYALSDSVNFYLTDFQNIELQPMQETPNLTFVLHFRPTVAKVFAESLTVHSSAGDLVIPITAESTSGRIYKGHLPRGTTILTKEQSPHIFYGLIEGARSDTLIIKPGATLLLYDTGEATMAFYGNVTLIAEGTREEPITIDAYDGNPSKKVWGQFANIKTTVLRYVNVRNFWGLCLLNNITVENVTFEHCTDKALLAVATYKDENPKLYLSNITTSDCVWGFDLGYDGHVENVHISNLTSIRNGRGIDFYVHIRDSTVVPPDLLENSIIMDCDLGFYASAGGLMAPDSVRFRNLCFWNNRVNSQGHRYVLDNPIYANPMLFSSPSYRYVLDPRSPCIDSGNPDSPRDPDGTIADLGAHPFDHNNNKPVLLKWDPDTPEANVTPNQRCYFEVVNDDLEQDPIDCLWKVGDTTFWGGGEISRRFEKPGRLIVAVQAFDGYNWSGTVDWIVNVAPLSANPEELTIEFAIHSVYPNPFNDLATLRYTLPGPGVVELSIFDIQGRTLLYNRDTRTAGGIITRVLDFGDYPTGVFFVKVSYGDKIEYRKMVHLR